MMQELEGALYAAYSTLNFSRHLLSLSTLFDNYGLVYLVNDADELEPDSFTLAALDEVVEVGSLALPILGRSRRVLRDILKHPKSSKTIDLELENVVLVEGFHINIVLEALLLKSGV